MLSSWNKLIKLTHETNIDYYAFDLRIWLIRLWRMLLCFLFCQHIKTNLWLCCACVKSCILLKQQLQSSTVKWRNAAPSRKRPSQSSLIVWCTELYQDLNFYSVIALVLFLPLAEHTVVVFIHFSRSRIHSFTMTFNASSMYSMY